MFSFTGQRYDPIDLLPKGKYMASVSKLEKKESPWGEYILIVWDIYAPNEYRGKTIEDRFRVNAQEEKIKLRAISDFTWLVEAYTGGPVLTPLNFRQMLYQKAELNIDTWDSPNGKKNVIRGRVPIARSTENPAARDLNAGYAPMTEGIELIEDSVPF